MTSSAPSDHKPSKVSVAQDTQYLKAPSKFLLAIEGRSIFELGAGIMSVPFVKSISPKAVEQDIPVLVLPGLGAGDITTKLLRSFLDAQGYSTYGWEQGVNRGMQGNTLPSIAEQVKRIHAKHNKKVAIIGQSLGGVFAREVAKMTPTLTRQVMTLGSPFTGDIDATNAKTAYSILSGKQITAQDKEFFEKVREKPSVFTTSIYSKLDGVVSWECSIERNKRDSENIELLGASHIGMCSSPQALYLIAHRLAQTERSWTPFIVPVHLMPFYRVEF